MATILKAEPWISPGGVRVTDVGQDSHRHMRDRNGRSFTVRMWMVRFEKNGERKHFNGDGDCNKRLVVFGETFTLRQTKHGIECECGS